MYTALTQIITLICEVVPATNEVSGVTYIQIPENLKVKRISIYVQEDLITGASISGLFSFDKKERVEDFVLLVQQRDNPGTPFILQVTKPEDTISAGFYLASPATVLGQQTIFAILFEGEQ